MIGDGWDGDPSTRPRGPDDATREPPAGVRRVAVVTGARSEFGLLRPVMHAIARHPALELACVAAGSHLIAPAETFREVKAEFNIADAVPMQIAGRTGRVEDAQALARGVGRFTRSFDRLRPDWVLVLGDRVEAFAAACAASVGGWALAHVHGGDRAEGVADEAMRHAITKLAHLHLPATPLSAERITRMGERPEHVHVVGSPAIDDLASLGPLPAARLGELGDPTAVLLFHPVGRSNEGEEAAAASLIEALAGERVLAFHPNHDPGREGVLRAIAASGVASVKHMPRAEFVGLLRSLAAASPPGVLVGNSSAAIIEAAALGLGVVDVGKRQAGRERCDNAVHADHEHAQHVRPAIARARAYTAARRPPATPYGDGRTGERIAHLLATVNPHDPSLTRKRCAF